MQTKNLFGETPSGLLAKVATPESLNIQNQ